MARVGAIGKEGLPVELHELWGQFSAGEKDFSNQAAVLAHSPGAFRHLYGLVNALRSEGSLSERLVEIAVVTTSRLNECPYCVAHHSVALERTGLPAESVSAILEPEVPGFSHEEHLVRDFARLIVERPWGILDDFHNDLQRHFTERQIVELTIRVGLCTLFNKFNQVMDIPVEDTFQSSLPERTR